MADFNDYLDYANNEDKENYEKQLAHENSQITIKNKMYSYLDEIIKPALDELSENKMFSYSTEINSDNSVSGVLIHTVKFSRESIGGYFDLYGYNDGLIVKLTETGLDNISFNVINYSNYIQPIESFEGNFLNLDKEDFKSEFVQKLKELHFYINRSNSKG